MTSRHLDRRRCRSARACVAAARLACVVALAAARALSAQTAPRPLGRDEAVQQALGRSGALGVARADSAVAYAQLLAARAWQNPVLSTSYSKSVPQYHVTAELPIDYPGVRGARVRAAQLGRNAARLRFFSARAAVALAADTTYTRALAARERLALSRRNAAAADSLRVIAERRRAAGDASDLDVELAAVNAAQQNNAALADSLAYVSALLDLQVAIGLAATDDASGTPLVFPSDSLGTPPPEATSSAVGVTPVAAGATSSAARPPLQVAAAEAALEAARLGTVAERRRVWASPSLTAGFETGDPEGVEKGILPTVGVALPLPILDRNRAPIAQAEAERQRAEAQLALARAESRAEIARARRARELALARVERDSTLVSAASRVATLSATAYREGAVALPSVLEAQRSAREAIAQYVADVADAWITTATLRALTLTSDTAR